MRGSSSITEVAVGAHQQHLHDGPLRKAIACGECHLVPATVDARDHIDKDHADVAWGSLASASAVVPSLSKTANALTCSNYCHGLSLRGGALTTPSWTIVDGSQARCGTCHGIPPPGPHPAVSSGLLSCNRCHPGTVRPDGVIDVDGELHINGNVDVGPLACTGCHGDPTRTPASIAAAPPVDTKGNTAPTAPGVGAHQRHLTGGTVRAALACSDCHRVPADYGHASQPLDLTWGALARSDGATPSFDATALTCSNYCHGATLSGGSNTTPKWTGGSAEVACGTCHGVPPPNPHPTVSRGLTACNACHSTTVDATGAIIPDDDGGTHVDGIVQASAGHSASWMDQTSPNFHAFSANRDLGNCQGCHGVALDGVGGMTTVACAQCHDQSLPAGVTSWKTNCVMCHGGTNDPSGAPPRATWGDLVRAGAHTAHVTGSAMAAAIDCAACHVKPLDALSSGHIDGPTATVTWGGVSTTSNAHPTWDRARATCASTYCHGGYSGTYTFWFYDGYNSVQYAGKNAAPSWTSGAMTCSSCHAMPPNSWDWHSGYHGGGNDCQMCHPDAVGTIKLSGGVATVVGVAITNPAQHVNGIIDVVPQWEYSTVNCFFCH